MNVAAYIRVSTDGQCGDDKFGLEVQETQLREYADKNGMVITRWFRDEGESGAKFRPGFDEIVYGEITNPPIEAVITAKSDRVARDINIYYYYKMCLLKKEIKLISICEDFDKFGVFAPMLEAFTVCVAQMERENINKRTSAGRKAKSTKGGFSGGRAPFGYVVQNHELAVEPADARIVKRIFFLREEMGKTYKEIADTLNEEGIPTRRGVKWHTSNIQNILNNRKTYEGMYKYGKNGEWVKGQHEPLLRPLMDIIETEDGYTYE